MPQLDHRIVTLARDLVARLDRQRRLCAAFRAGACQRLTALAQAAAGVRDGLLDALERDPDRARVRGALEAADLRLRLLAEEARAGELEPLAAEEIARAVRELREAIGVGVAAGVNHRG